jgi:hypothetical protein
MGLEVRYLDGACSNPTRPFVGYYFFLIFNICYFNHYLSLCFSFVGILGGAKIGDKLSVVSNLAKKVDKLIIGGGMSYTFQRAKGFILFLTDSLSIDPFTIALMLY